MGVIVGYLTKLLTTSRERKEKDLDIINAAISPLLNSIKELTIQNKELITKLADEQTATLKQMQQNKSLLEERVELVGKIDKLTRQVELLKKALLGYMKEAPLNNI